jgi:hypothetical protein
MSDMLLKIGQNGSARRLLKTIGLPLSLPPTLRPAAAGSDAQPMAGRSELLRATAAGQAALARDVHGSLVGA